MESEYTGWEIPSKFEIVSPYLIVADLKKCAGCGQDHDGMHFYQTHGEYRAKCPASNNTVYVRAKE